MPAAVNTFFEERLERLFDLAALVETLFSRVGLEYRVVGGLAAYLYVEEAQPDAGRLTRDIDIMARRVDLDAIAKAAPAFGLEYRHVAGVDMLVQVADPSARRAVHIVFCGEKVRDEYPEPTPEMGESRTLRGVRLVPLASLLRMKLSSFLLKDQTHIQDLDEAGLITPVIEASLSDIHRQRLAEVRSHR